MRFTITVTILFSGFISYGQKAIEDLNTLQGIWIAEDYHNSFENTKSAIKSKNAFDYNYPVGLRINPIEIKNGVLNIGYAELHDHIIHPEVSDYIVKNNDTIREFSFNVNLRQKDSSGYYKTSDIHYFNYDWVSYLTWNVNDNSISLYRPEGNEHAERFIKYIRVTNGFDNDHLFPNPLYYYTRQKTLKGTYTLKDNEGTVLSKNFQIDENGIANGYGKFENFTFYFSTDIYCGPPINYDLIIGYEDVLTEESKTFVFLLVINEDGNISLHKKEMNNTTHSYELGEKAYELIKN